jgi:carboxymethylenebutenolidase
MAPVNPIAPAAAPTPASTSAERHQGVAVAAQPPAATTITTASVGLLTGWSGVDTGDVTLPLYYARPPGPGPFPVVLVVQEIFGVHEHIADVVRRLALLGYLAIAPELYVRQGDPRTAVDLTVLRRDFVSKADDAVVLADLDRAVSWAATQGGDLARLAITGFCWGGRITWLYAAHEASVKAAVAWYGRLDGERTPHTPQHPIDVAGRLLAPVLGLYGGQDQGITLSQVETMRAALSAANSPSRIEVFPDAPHAFYADYRPSYRADAAADGWKQLVSWFAQHGVA